jgi:hypothetical protein
VVVNAFEITTELLAERKRQDGKWNRPHEWGHGDCSSPDVAMLVKAAVLAEEAGEVVKAVLDAGPDEAATDPDVRREVIQTLAVAYAILEGM